MISQRKGDELQSRPSETNVTISYDAEGNPIKIKKANESGLRNEVQYEYNDGLLIKKTSSMS